MLRIVDPKQRIRLKNTFKIGIAGYEFLMEYVYEFDAEMYECKNCNFGPQWIWNQDRIQPKSLCFI